MYVTELARYAGVRRDTIRYYTKIGLLDPGRHPENSNHVYGHKDGSRLKFIRAAKALGYTLADIRKIFADAKSGKSACPRTHTLIEKRIKETEGRLVDLTPPHQRMVSALQAWESLPDSQPSAESVCTLIELLEDNIC